MRGLRHVLRSLVKFGAVGAACAACSCCAPEPEPQPEPAPGQGSFPYQGPPVQAAFAKGGPLRIEVTAPTAGYELRRDDLAWTSGEVAVRCTLVAPAAGAMVAQVISRHALEVPLEELRRGGAFAAVRVEVAQIQRDTHYFVAPPHELAARVPAPR